MNKTIGNRKRKVGHGMRTRGKLKVIKQTLSHTEVGEQDGHVISGEVFAPINSTQPLIRKLIAFQSFPKMSKITN